MTAKQLKNSILQMAVQGKLVPQNPADEPASVLLEKISREKDRLVKEGKIKADKNPSRIFRGGEVEGTEKDRFYEQVGNGKVVDITDELPFEIPESWEWARLGTISGLISGRDLETRYFNDKKNGIPYITGASNIENDKIYVNRWTDNPCCIAQRGDLLFVCKGTVGKMAFLQEEKVHIARQIMAIRNLYTLHFLYIYYFIKYYIESIQKNAKGIIPGISRESLLDCLIPLPPLNEQTRIASKIDSLLPHISAYAQAESALITLNSTFPTNLKKSILQAAIQGKLVPQDPNDEPASVLLDKIRAERKKLIAEGKIKKPKTESHIFKRDGSWFEKVGNEEKCIDGEIPFDIPENWAWARLGDIGYFIRGSGIKRSEIIDKGQPCIRYGEIYTTFNIFFSKNKSFIPEELSKNLKNIDNGDLLFTLTGENKEEIGKTVAYLGNSPLVAGGDLGIYKWHYQNPMYLAYLLNSPYCIQRKASLGTGNIIVHISCDKLSTILVPIPPLNEQKLIADKITTLFSNDATLNQLCQ